MRKYFGLPDVLVPLDVDLVELARDRRDEVLLHLHRHVLRQHGEQEALLKSAIMNKILSNVWFPISITCDFSVIN